MRMRRSPSYFRQRGILGALVSGGLGLLGGILGSKGADKRNDQSIALSKEQMDWSERMSNTAHQREMADLSSAGLNPMLSARAGASTPGGPGVPQLENSLATGVNSATASVAAKAQIDQVKSATDMNEANAMKARAEAWQITNYGGAESNARINSAQSGIALNEFRMKEVDNAIELVKEQIKTEPTKRMVNVSDFELNEVLRRLNEAKITTEQLSFDRSKAESAFYKEGAIGEHAPALKLIMDIVKGVSATRGR